METFEIQGAFRIVGKGYVLACNVPEAHHHLLYPGNIVQIDGEVYMIRSVEMARTAFSYSSHVAILIHGELEQDTNFYRGKRLLINNK